MKATIVGIPGCSKCKMLSTQFPDVNYVVPDQNVLLAFARAIGVQSLPIVVLTGDQDELASVLRGANGKD